MWRRVGSKRLWCEGPKGREGLKEGMDFEACVSSLCEALRYRCVRWSKPSDSERRGCMMFSTYTSNFSINRKCAGGLTMMARSNKAISLLLEAWYHRSLVPRM